MEDNNESLTEKSKEELEKLKIQYEIAILQKEKNKKWYKVPTTVAAYSTSLIATLAFLSALFSGLFSDERKRLQNEADKMQGIVSNYAIVIDSVRKSHIQLDLMTEEAFQVQNEKYDVKRKLFEVDFSEDAIVIGGIYNQIDSSGTFYNSDLIDQIVCLNCLTKVESSRIMYDLLKIEPRIRESFVDFQNLKNPLFTDFENLINEIVVVLDELNNGIISQRDTLQLSIRTLITDVTK